MPELPEVETTRRGILPHVKNQKIVNLIIRQFHLRFPIATNLPVLLKDQTILDISRRAKYLLMHTKAGVIILHLGMSGHLRILDTKESAKKHDHIDIRFSNSKILRFTDPRRFGAFLWQEGDPFEHILLKNLGVEPLTKDFTGKYLWSKAQGRVVPIKSLLMDSKIVVGIGNIYAAEALFAAGIDPRKAARSLSLTNYQLLVTKIKQILKKAIQRGGTTLKDFLNTDGKPGYFFNQLNVYGRSGLSCVKCQTTLQSIVIAQRNTVFCTTCQN